MNRSRFIVALAIMISIVTLANAAISTAFVAAFAVPDSFVKLAYALPIALSFAFIGAMFVSQKWYNPLTRAYYFLTAVWMGYFVYALIVSALYAFVNLIYPFAGIAVAARALFILAACAVAYGIAHERNIVTKNVEVKLSNLPPSWKGRKAVFVSDFHLGQIHSEKFCEKVVKKINAINPDIVLIGGDLYDGSVINAEINAAPLAKLTAPLGTFYVTGNHEEFRDNVRFVDSVRAAGVKIQNSVNADIDGLQIAGVGYSEAENKEAFRGILSKLNIDRSKPSILLKHEPADIEVAAEAGISLQLSGHTHRAQMWPLGYIARLVYKKFEYGLNRFGNTLVYTSSGVGSWGPPIRIGTNSEIVVMTFI